MTRAEFIEAIEARGFVRNMRMAEKYYHRHNTSSNLPSDSVRANYDSGYIVTYLDDYDVDNNRFFQLPYPAITEALITAVAGERK